MGKGNRNKKGRRGGAEKAPIEMLFKAFLAVEDLYGTETKCVEACVMLYGIAKHLGYDLKPRAVSVGVHDFTSGVSVVLGKKILEGMSPEAQAAAVGVLDGDENLGHVILTMDDPAYLLDPNISQVKKLGANVSGICRPIRVTEGIYGWELKEECFSIDYELNGSSKLLTNFYELAELDDAHHRETAGWLRSGMRLARNPTS
ncbi:hypothetical protein [Arthrobacter sp. E3]|uniref:hypothetical protein n=1 Tax=Arthrobacter sp. E3 TaxID=517402 RepID=UPI001A94767F|nr:hypothetical protein [Arthrobacter sp. E3]